jgi:choline kinase
MMLSHIRACGISDVIFVLGYLQDRIEEYVHENFPKLDFQFIRNSRYKETNTGFSLMLCKDFIKDSAFVKFGADVVFDRVILKNLVVSEYENCLCIDKNINLDAEEIKVIMEGDNKIVRASKTVDLNHAIGASVGMEKIGEKRQGYCFLSWK